jgi:hypothetical protein
MAEKKITNLVSYIALGVSVVALAVAVFGGCPKRPRHGFGGERGPHPEMMGGPRGGHEQRPDMRGGQRGQPNGKPGFGGDHRGPRPDGQKPETPKAKN